MYALCRPAFCYNTGATQQITEIIATLGYQRCYEWAWPGVTRQIVESIATWGQPRKCYEWVWPSVTRKLAESIAARGRPRGCYEWALVRPGRDN